MFANNTNSSSMYAWFDWEDQTTSVNSLNVIKTPRKEFDEYCVGEKVIAKLPQYEGLWEGVIVEISVSRSMLMAGLKERQKKQIEEMKENDSGTTSPHDSDKEQRHEKQNEKQRHKSADSLTGKRRKGDLEQNSDRKRHKSSDVAQVNRKKTKDKAEPNKTEITKHKEQKKAAVNDKLVAKKLQLDDIISNRRTSAEDASRKNDIEEPEAGISDETVVTEEQQPPNFEQVSPGNAPWQPQFSPQQQQPQAYVQHQHQQQAYGQHQHQQQAYGQQQQQTYGQQQLSYGWLPNFPNWPTSPPEQRPQYADLFSNRELQEERDMLKEENNALKKRIEEMQEKLDRKSNEPGISLTPRKLSVLKTIVNAFEGASSHDTNISESAVTPFDPRQEEVVLEDDRIEDEPPQEITHNDWESPVTGSGAKKVQLLKTTNVFLTQGQLSMALLQSGGDVRKLVVKLLEVFFTKEQLAKGNALGKRHAHNTSSTTQPLPCVVLQTILEFCLQKYKRDSGEPAITNSEFNRIVNSKCSTARRSLK